MVDKLKKEITGAKEEKKGRVKIGGLKLNKLTVKELSDSQARKVKGRGAGFQGTTAFTCVKKEQH